MTAVAVCAWAGTALGIDLCEGRANLDPTYLFGTLPQSLKKAFERRPLGAWPVVFAATNLVSERAWEEPAFHEKPHAASFPGGFSSSVWNLGESGQDIALSPEMQQKWEGVCQEIGEHLPLHDLYKIKASIAALNNDDVTWIYAGEELHKILNAAQKRFAKEHGVSADNASAFAVHMGKKPLRESLLTLAKVGLHPLRSFDFMDHYDEEALKTFLINRCYVCPEVNSKEKQAFFKRFWAIRSLKETANAMLERRVSQKLLETLPLPVMLRATSLVKTTPDLAATLARVGKMEEARALAVLFLLKKHHQLQNEFWQTEPPFLTPYLEWLVKDNLNAFSVLTDSDVFPLVLRYDGLTEEEIALFESNIPVSLDAQKTYALNFFQTRIDRRQEYLKTVSPQTLLLAALENVELGEAVPFSSSKETEKIKEA